MFLSVLLTDVFSQEVITYSSENKQIRKYISENKSSSNNKLGDTLSLPFWDDFSDSDVYPNSAKWSNNYVFINSNFIDKAPSVGVATFDALDSIGLFYENTDYETPRIADYLTSKPISLNYPDNNTVYISFYYRAGGYGDIPELQDSLILEFYSPETGIWEKAWFALGGEDIGFQFAIVQISDNKFLQNGFKFRFKNYISLGSDIYPSLAGNCDFWHIDYVYLNINRNINDNKFSDVAFTTPLHSLSNIYEEIPWEHYKVSNLALNRSLNINFRNHNDGFMIIDSLNVYLKDLSNNTSQKIEGGASNVPPYTDTQLDFSQSFIFNQNNNTFADFEVKAELITDSQDSLQNNTISYLQKFRDCYAYDDGTAEAGYGLYGTGTKYGSIAYKFYPEKADNLLGVKMYFTRTLNDASQKYFWLDFRTQNGDGSISSPVYQLQGVQPEYENGNYNFHYYEFPVPQAVSDTFYIGWTQTTEDMLNVGIDFSKDASNNLYYNISGTWQQSQVSGAVMIRPVFGQLYSDAEDIKKTNSFFLYPNPTSYYINISDESNSINSKLHVEIFDITGKRIMTAENQTSNINISNLKTGIYFVRIQTDGKNEVLKFIKR